jgi:hypothetical protein
MKKFIYLAPILLLFSCANFEKASRHIASYEDVSFKKDTYRVGEIKISLLRPNQFRSLYGSSWVLMDGSNQEGTLFAQTTGMSTVPDARGAFLRMQNNGRNDGLQNPENTSVGVYQNEDTKSHTHGIGAVSAGRLGYSGGPNPTFTNGNGSTAAYGGNETRPKNITVNYFIKVTNCTTDEINCL